ncbi:hypothetical protein D3C77_628310 [compost metagenome]
MRTVQVASVGVNERMVGGYSLSNSGFIAQGYGWGGLTTDENSLAKKVPAAIDITWYAEGD